MGHYSSPLTPTMGPTPLIPTMGHYSSPTDTNDGALFLPLTPMMGHLPTEMMGHYDGALFLPLTNDGALFLTH
ncbi:unnamed protein product [Staurois parvus]|uniref:Uncharacterized protein n=1 Tax=Staurois parvus TaxID=386267 RepID=A0ABN9DZ27_9NEOB|nr:unnamed protein product [Staurois parvus]